MRAIGRTLGVAAMGLYRHITDKSELLQAMVEFVAAEYDLDALSQDWRTGLVQLAQQQRALIARHPWLPTLASRYHPLGPATLAYVERVLELLDRAGTPQTSLLETAGLFNGLVTAIAVAANSPPPALTDNREQLEALLATGAYPRFAALAGQPHLNLDDEFERLVLRLVDGLTIPLQRGPG